MTMSATTIDDPAGGAEAPAFHLTQEHAHPEGASNLIGFWLYLMSDALIFAALFVTYAVLGVHYAGGPHPADLFDISLVAFNTAVMLISSFTCGLAMVETGRGRRSAAMGWLAVTGLLGVCFVLSQIAEYQHFRSLGATIDTSAFLSAFFALVATHALHVVAGLIWVVVLMAHIQFKGMDAANRKRVICFSMFWNFLDITWVCVFTFVYLMGLMR